MPLGWFRSRRRGGKALESWRGAWRTAATEPSAAAADLLRRDLEALALPEDDIEVEREMLAGLDAAAAFVRRLDDGLPRVQTGHRVVGTDVCHLIVNASLPDDRSQPAGRLIFTDRRAIFAGGPHARTLAWHAVSGAVADGRDLVLIARGAEPVRFRCNSYEDALCGWLLARRLSGAGRPAGARIE
jgi:hypothetical protein